MAKDKRNGATEPARAETGETSRRRDLRQPLASGAMPESVACPFCDGTETEQFSAFGSTLSVSQYYCRDCRNVFEWMKWRRG